MNYGLYLSAMGLKAQMVRQSVISNNLANSHTAGFKRDLLLMQSRENAVHEDPSMYPYRVPVVQDQGGGVFAVGNGIDLSQSTFEDTGNATDLALDGRGFFTVGGTGAEQTKLLTRDGRFLMDAQGNLRMASGGRPVLDSNGRPIVLDPNLPVSINSSGEISQGDLLAGAGGKVKLGIVDIKNSQQLMKLGGNVMRATSDAALTDADPATQVRSGVIETSGVDPMSEMISMMDGFRAFEANAKMISYQDQTLSQINTIGRVA
jgi:flagellar basal-body rod protein FlgF